MKKVAIVGHFGFGLNYCDGQTVKTKNLAKELDSRYGEDEVLKLDTHGGLKRILKIIISLVKIQKQCKNVLILPAYNGLKIIAPVLALCKKHSDCSLHYAVVGGWLPVYLDKNQFLKRSLLQFDAIYVETSTMKQELEKRGLHNVLVMANFKDLTPLKKEQLSNHTTKPFRLCTFSRVMAEKGIGDAITLVKQINEQCENVVYQLDIYGPVDPQQQEWFQATTDALPDYIRYCGTVPPEQSVAALQDYDFLLFPTKYYTEGVPGTIIDAYASGIPVISCRWMNFADVVDHGITGWGYEFDNLDALKELLLQLPGRTEEFASMRLNCLKKAEDFLPCNAVAPLIKNLK